VISTATGGHAAAITPTGAGSRGDRSMIPPRVDNADQAERVIDPLRELVPMGHICPTRHTG